MKACRESWMDVARTVVSFYTETWACHFVRTKDANWSDGACAQLTMRDRQGHYPPSQTRVCHSRVQRRPTHPKCHPPGVVRNIVAVGIMFKCRGHEGMHNASRQVQTKEPSQVIEHVPRHRLPPACHRKCSDGPGVCLCVPTRVRMPKACACAQKPRICVSVYN